MKKQVGLLILMLAMAMGCESPVDTTGNQDETSVDQLDDNLDLLAANATEDEELVEDQDDVGDEEIGESRSRGKRVRFRRHVRRLTRRKLLAMIDESLSDIDKRAVAAKATFLCHLDIKTTVANEFDSDGDGSLSDDERSELRDSRRTRRQNVREKYDADGSGSISRDEAKQIAEGVSDARVAAIRNKFDADDDGVITSDEVDADGLPTCEIPDIE